MLRSSRFFTQIPDSTITQIRPLSHVFCRACKSALANSHGTNCADGRKRVNGLSAQHRCPGRLGSGRPHIRTPQPERKISTPTFSPK
ncbi:JM109 [macacine gammaherpesvirus 11]|uniref:JM109 n=2 Tax=macacine gammaherpesvirus 11 TaxID=2560570 RepID=G9JMT7_9GAMA|nr:JM109 [Macaca fuscata rhadinovirus]AAT00086.1 JM109 [Macaca fuscata rhadinovirus]AEW87634.1 JM109 [Macaca fuscata rhadinovirus]AEW87804.1 JM109 [Macaca fuscata rhadinovirus]